MVIQPKVRGFLCTTTHPTGCFENVRRQAEHVRSKGVIAEGPGRVLVLGASTGYGLASRITAALVPAHRRLASSSRNRAPTASPVPPAGITQRASISWRTRQASTQRASMVTPSLTR